MENPGAESCTYHTTAVWASRCWSHGKGCATLPEVTSPQCSLEWPDTPRAQGLTSSPSWPGLEPVFLLGLLLIPSKSLKTCCPPSAPPWPVQPPLLRVAAYIGLACTNAKLHTRTSAYLDGQGHFQLNSNQHQPLLPYRRLSTGESHKVKYICEIL